MQHTAVHLGMEFHRTQLFPLQGMKAVELEVQLAVELEMGEHIQ